jgi:hypothetical protein
MRWTLWASALWLVACQASHPGPLLGTWRSDEELTLHEVERADLSPKQREFFREPGFFGDLELRYEVDRVHSSYHGAGSWRPYQVVGSGPGFVQIEYMDPLTGEMTRPKLLVEGDLMKMPVRNLGFHEVFRRVEPDEDTCQQPLP